MRYLERGTFLILAATTFASTSHVVVHALLARLLEPSEYGTFCSALAIVSLLSTFAAFGVGSLWLRLFGEEGNGAWRWVQSSLRFALITSLGAMFLLVAWANLGPHDTQTRLIITFLAGVILAQGSSDLVSAWYQIEAKSIPLALWQVLNHPARLLGIIALAYFVQSPSATDVAAVYLLVSAVVCSLSLAILARLYDHDSLRYGRIDIHGHSQLNIPLERPSLKAVIHRALPFGLEGLLFGVYYQSDVILLRYLKNEEAAGTYGAGVAILAVAYFLPSVLYQKILLPRIHVISFGEIEKFKKFIIEGGTRSFLFGLFVTIIIWLGAPDIVPLILGEKYESLVPLLGLMTLAIPFRYLAIHFGCALSTRDYIWLNVKISAVVALLNVILNIFLIPIHGEVGAAFATIVSYIIMTYLYYLAIYNRIRTASLGAQR